VDYHLFNNIIVCYCNSNLCSNAVENLKIRQIDLYNSKIISKQYDKWYRDVLNEMVRRHRLCVTRDVMLLTL
jgi:hypothetical protein